MNYELLNQLVTFYKTKTLRETSEKLHISQPTLTRNMQRLEMEFNVVLFNRTKNSISLNETGIAAAEDAEMLLKQMDNMFRHIREVDRLKRTITLGSCTPVLIPDIVRRLSSLYPKATITSETAGIKQLKKGLEENTFHLILLPHIPDSSLCYWKVCDEHLSFLLPKKHKFAHRKSLSSADMNGENMLLFQEIGFWHNLVKEKMPNSRFLLQSERYDFMELIENSILPSFTTVLHYESLQNQKPIKDRIAVPISDPEFNVTYYLVCKKENREKFSGLL